MNNTMINQQNKIAIVIPVYNAEKYIRKCIKSFQNQTLQDFKLILVDDGSQDRSGEICDQMAKIDSRILVIHKENEGSVKARKDGVLNPEAQKTEHIFFSDADDFVEKNALEKLHKFAKKYDADCVCANMRKYWKGIKFNNKYQNPCFKIEEPQEYNTKDILEKLYISCFGISDYPVNLVAKLYKTELISKAMKFPVKVKFMGDDLSVTLRCLPLTKKLVIVPDIIYNYRIGGNTSKFMPYMLNDFLVLYQTKMELIKEYQMPQDAKYFTNVELMNVIFSWLKMCKKEGNYSEKLLREEIERICNISEVSDAAICLCKREKPNHIAVMVEQRNFNKIYNELEQMVYQERIRDKIKEILMRL